jgi:hypothetical protein
MSANHSAGERVSPTTQEITMQILDIKIAPASTPDELSRVRFIGEGGDEVAVTIANHTQGGPTIEQELVAKAKVMLLHAAAAQASDRRAAEPVIVSDAEDASGNEPPDEEQDNPFQNPDDALPSDEAEEAIAEGMAKRSGRFEA